MSIEDSDTTAPAGSGEGDPTPDFEVETSSDVAQDAASEEGSEPEEQAEPEAPEEVEFDFGGKKLRIPKGSVPEEVAAELDRFTKGTWQDYTRKSQAVAEQAKALEAEKSAVQRLGSLENEKLENYARGLLLRQEVERLSQVDIEGLWQSNPDQARMLSDRLNMKQRELHSVASQVAAAEAAIEQERTKATEAETQQASRRAEEGRKAVVAQIKGFDEDALVAYAAKTYGVTPEIAKAQWPHNPAGAVVAWKAMQYDRMQANAAKAAKPTPTPASPIVPIKGKAATRADPNQMSDDEYYRWEMSQLAKRGR
jgi:hypothetical protein